MKRVFGIHWCLVALAMTLFVSMPDTARADLMSACQANIAKWCSGVPDGRGRISACLMSYSSKLDAACRSEVDAVAKKSQNNILLPKSVRSLMGAGSAPAVPAECAADQGKFCSGVDAGGRNALACLYAYSGSVSAPCADGIKAALK
ncbi:cysteine rich repeat-containing protein [Acuticoccus sp. MNP-M23]|uniref:cysteine rich repeat-containing protein n=1 Tax=Acuticoccus sp. MNP-M23 TaxID=3072793 RepID=UPI002815E1A7|nr:cysteine rich repeat-containing protein [Acuticoccus sp. MNP-M23]WMS41949.1 cysteine rich repeat-containing protein [Acuticoccus sp. MNP-M23]